MKINKKFSIENRLITILILSLIVVFSIEIIQTKIQAKNLTIYPIESNKNKENTNLNNEKPSSNPVSTPSKANEDIKNKLDTDNPSDPIQTADTVSDETYIEDNSSDYWYPTDDNVGGGNNNKYPEYTPIPPSVNSPVTPVIQDPPVVTPDPPAVQDSPVATPAPPVVTVPPVTPNSPIVPDPPVVPENPDVPPTEPNPDSESSIGSEHNIR